MRERKTKKALEKDKELARMYYLNGESQMFIADKTGISRTTINKWVNEGAWNSLRTATKLTRKELSIKVIGNLNKKLEDGKDISSDELSKFAASIKTLDKETNILTIIDVLMMYSDWLVARMKIDKELNTGLVKTMNRYQDIFVSEQMTKPAQE
ncbi:hypothetical protein EZS27_006079 [termite gut metagenome]|uniref:Uncharacterized protein n=1 Tax=termite gut metagenome TaxID=433724 RepID=A0A5J4SJX3_9ZZZZ